MKKILRFLPLLLIAVTGVAFAACSDDKDEPVSANSLPAAAKSFLEAYYPSVNIVSATKDHDDYDVVLANGHKVEFDAAGNWTDVDAPAGQSIPNGFYPAAIDIYVGETYNGTGINEISKTASGFDVELTTGVDLLFNADGTFVAVDR